MNFDQKNFALILAKAQSKFDTQKEFAKACGIGRTNISEFINMRLNKPPSPKILRKIAAGSRGVTTYGKLILVCGYLDEIDFAQNREIAVNQKVENRSTTH